MNDIEWVLTKLEEWIDDNTQEYGSKWESPYMIWDMIDVEELKKKIHELKEASN